MLRSGENQDICQVVAWSEPPKDTYDIPQAGVGVSSLGGTFELQFQRKSLRPDPCFTPKPVLFAMKLKKIQLRGDYKKLASYTTF